MLKTILQLHVAFDFSQFINFYQFISAPSFKDIENKEGSSTALVVCLAHQENFKKPRNCPGIPGVVRSLSI